MDTLPLIYQTIRTNIFWQYFLVGMLGSIFFDLTIYFNENLRNYSPRYKVMETRKFQAAYLFSQTIYSGCFGGILALFANHALWLSFITGFFNSVFISFVVKSFLLNSTKSAFWFTIGKVIYIIIGEPLRKLSSVIDTFSNEDERNKNDKKR